MSAISFRVAHASRVLAKASRVRELFEKIVLARPQNQHARRVRYPILLLALTIQTINAQDSSGYGPATAVPVTRSTIARSTIPPQNWIDQTQTDANAKSVGCLQCHQGVE